MPHIYPLDMSEQEEDSHKHTGMRKTHGRAWSGERMGCNVNSC